MLRFYHFKVQDLLNSDNPNFNILIDPKADYALRHIEEFPKEVNTSSYYDLLKVPGIGVKSAKRILSSRRVFKLCFDDLKKMGVVLKRAKYFITCGGKYCMDARLFKKEFIEKNLVLEEFIPEKKEFEQLRLFNE